MASWEDMKSPRGPKPVTVSDPIYNMARSNKDADDEYPGSNMSSWRKETVLRDKLADGIMTFDYGETLEGPYEGQNKACLYRD